MKKLISFRGEYQAGGAPLIVFLHGLFGSASNWQSISRSLIDDFQVLMPDLRNHGDSFHDFDVSYSTMADDVWRLLDEIGVLNVVLVGHSMGGKVAMKMASDQPHRTLGLAVVDIAPVNYQHDFSDIFQAFDSVDLITLQQRSEAFEKMGTAISNNGIRHFLLQNLQHKNHRWHWRLNIAALEAGIDSITGFTVDTLSYTGPTSFIFGGASDYIQAQHRQSIEEQFPNVKYCQVQNAGHWVYAEQPKAFMRCLQRFLARIPNIL